MSRVFRGKFLDYLGQAYRDDKLSLTASLEHLQDPACFHALLRDVRRKPWVVYSKAPMAGPEQVLKYLARYTHRVAIANSRLLSLEDGRISFRYKDYAQGGRQRVLSLDGVEFLRRFLLHVLPRGFVRIRSYGLLANCCRREKLALCRSLIDPAALGVHHDARDAHADSKLAGVRCSQCGLGVMLTIEIFRPYSLRLPALPATLDSS